MSRLNKWAGWHIFENWISEQTDILSNKWAGWHWSSNSIREQGYNMSNKRAGMQFIESKNNTQSIQSIFL